MDTHAGCEVSGREAGLMELADKVLDLRPGPIASPRVGGWNVHSLRLPRLGLTRTPWGSANAYGWDANGHGNHAAGILGGHWPDLNHCGMAPKARLLSYKVLGDEGKGGDAKIIKCLDHIDEANRKSLGLRTSARLAPFNLDPSAVGTTRYATDFGGFDDTGFLRSIPPASRATPRCPASGQSPWTSALATL